MPDSSKNPELHFIYGAARSGTTWLSNALNVHPEVFATEQRLFGDFSELWQGRNGVAVPRISAEKYLRTFWRHFHADQSDKSTDFSKLMQRWIDFVGELGKSVSGKRVVIDKVTPWFGLEESIFGSIRRRCRQSKIVFLLRDGRDVVTSGLFDSIQRQPGRPLRKIFVQGHPEGWRLERLFDDESIAEWSTYWNRTSEVILTNPKIPVIRYEQMLKNQAQELGRLLTEFEVDHSSDQLKACVSASSFRAITGREPGDGDSSAKNRRGVSGDWKNWFTRRDGEIFAELAGKSLAELGYLSGDANASDWLESLPDRLELPPPA
jgi:hypothetical protein